MDDQRSDSSGPFSVLAKKYRKRSAMQHSKKLRDLLGENAQVESDSDASKCSESSSRQNEEEYLSEARKSSVASSTFSSKSENNSYDKATTTNKSKEFHVKDIELKQNTDPGIVAEECDRMKELTKGIEGMNNEEKRDNNISDVITESGKQFNDRGVTDRECNLKRETSSQSCNASPTASANEKSGSNKVKRKYNLFYHEMEELGTDSGLDEQGAPSHDEQNNYVRKAIDQDRNTPSDKVPSDGLLSSFRQNQMSGKAKKRHFSSNGSDFDRKMGSPISSRSSSMRSYSSSVPASVDSGLRMGYQEPHSSVVVVAIDFGTTFSGYAFAFTRDPESIHMMRKWEGGDPGVNNQKIPTTLLLKPDGSFHSFGYGARDFYHDLEQSEAKKWLYFEKFKMSLHSSEVWLQLYDFYLLLSIASVSYFKSLA